MSPTAESGAAPAMPSLYDDADDADDADAFAPTQLHANAEPPPAMPQPSMSQPLKSPQTEALPSVPAKSLSEAAARPRTPIPFDPEPHVRAPETLPLVPLAVGFGIFFVGLLVYLLIR